MSNPAAKPAAKPADNSPALGTLRCPNCDCTDMHAFAVYGGCYMHADTLEQVEFLDVNPIPAEDAIVECFCTVETEHGSEVCRYRATVAEFRAVAISTIEGVL